MLTHNQLKEFWDLKEQYWLQISEGWSRTLLPRPIAIHKLKFGIVQYVTAPPVNVRASGNIQFSIYEGKRYNRQ